MTTTNNLNITLIEQSQAQKEVTVNAAITKLEALINRGAEDKDLATPPVSPADGDVYIVEASATDDWYGHDGELAYFDQIWRFLTPNEGMNIWVNDEDKLYVYDGSTWVSVLSAASYENLSGVGVNTISDATNKLAVKSDAALFTADEDDIQVKLNKIATSDTASFVFQKDFASRAEFGLVGEDNFSLKVSPDGSTFYQSFVLDKDNGNADFKQDVAIDGELKAKRGSVAVGASKALALTDANSFQKVDSVSAVTITIPTNAAVAFDENIEIDFARLGSGAVTISPDSGVTLRSVASADDLASQYSVAHIKKIATDEWLLWGDIV